VWVNQPAQPFLRPAFVEGAPEAVKVLEKELDHTYRKVWKRG
jgi:hypothetical protein